VSNPRLKPDSLAFSLLGAARAVAAVMAGSALPQALAGVFSPAELPPAVRGAIQDIAYVTMRGLGRSQALLDLLADKRPAQP
jgi:16S rRNA (cytosine967-C5)-methyltransferase